MKPYIVPSLVLGFHGCDRSVAEKILAGKDDLKPSENEYAWLGHGIYFWENDPDRARQYAEHLKRNPERTKTKVNEPFVLGAILNLGSCLNLLQYDHLEILKTGYQMVEIVHKNSGTPLLKNKPVGKEKDLLLRPLDCEVIEMIHTWNAQEKRPMFDSVRGVFFEGEELYPNAGFKEKNHIQICIRNKNCIIAYFKLRDST